MGIRVLSPQVANQIAAGEVVERPASVVRELVDNAIDAGADDVSISLVEGGRTLIRVVDNGVGMSREDGLLAFERHATSKLSELSDLDQIESLGFRGEALPAICSVSRVRMQTKRTDEQLATEILLDTGTVQQTRCIPGPVGTTMEVMQLFLNTPARQKFLKSTRSEELRVKQWLVQYALSRPQVAFRLESDGRELFRESPRASLVDRARVLIGAGVVSGEMTVNGIRVEAALAHPSQAKVETRGLTLIVNSRVVSDRMLLRAAKDGFGGALKDREFPSGVISISLPGTEVDVNVHPQKSEVRFRNSSAVYVAVLRAVQSMVAEFRAPMSASAATSSAQFDYRGTLGGFSGQSRGFTAESSRSRTGYEARSTIAQAGLRFGDRQRSSDSVDWGQEVAESGTHERGNEQSVGARDLEVDSTENFSFRKLVFRGQLFECYLLCELSGAFYIVDMHAAHERYQYNRVRAALRTRDISAQHLLLPLSIDLSEQEFENLKSRQVMLEDLGFAISWEKGKSITLQEIPSILVNRDVARTLRDIAAIDPDEGGGVGPLEYLLDQIAARVACHASIRSGKRMTTPEVEALFALLDSSACSAACPHGRPVIVSFSESEVEHWFGRDR